MRSDAGAGVEPRRRRTRGVERDGATFAVLDIDAQSKPRLEWQRDDPASARTTRVLGLASAVALGAGGVYVATRSRRHAAYAIDGAIEAGFALVWLLTGRRRSGAVELDASSRRAAATTAR